MVNRNKIVVEGFKVESPRSKFLATPPKEANKGACPLCRLGLKGLAYTVSYSDHITLLPTKKINQDVLIISQFVEPNGNMMAIEKSQLCGTKYHLVKKLVRQAQECKLLPRPDDWEVYGPWDELNSYHEQFKRYRDQPMKQVQPEFWQKPRLYN